MLYPQTHVKSHSSTSTASGVSLSNGLSVRCSFTSELSDYSCFNHREAKQQHWTSRFRYSRRKSTVVWTSAHQENTYPTPGPHFFLISSPNKGGYFALKSFDYISVTEVSQNHYSRWPRTRKPLSTQVVSPRGHHYKLQRKDYPCQPTSRPIPSIATTQGTERTSITGSEN